MSEGKWYLVPIYYVLVTSQLAQEAVTHSGSYRFADHVYAGKPKGKYGIGYLLDALLLKLPSASAFRYRYERVRHEMEQHIRKSRGSSTKILYVPSGLARELFEIEQSIDKHTDDPSSVHIHGLDLDTDLVESLNQRASQARIRMTFHSGDALFEKEYSCDHDFVASTGFLDFLNDADAARFFQIIYKSLKPGGTFVTSGMQPHKLSDFLMRQFAELNAVYRTKDQLIALARHAGFSHVEFIQDRHGLQTVITASK